jgi:hypothetical protein
MIKIIDDDLRAIKTWECCNDFHMVAVMRNKIHWAFCVHCGDRRKITYKTKADELEK